MKAFPSVALFSLLSLALGQDDNSASGSLASSPTQSVGCTTHGDHWHCKGPRVTSSPVVITTTISGVAVATTSIASHDHDHDGDHDHDDHSYTAAPGTGSLKPSPTESHGCEAHGDHWDCAGPVTATGATSTGATPTARTTRTDSAATVTGGASRLQAAGLGFVALAVGMAL
ncbi:hypothetical protein CONLIGDRAFT_715669 [Coniochaeta ligniaria NRRL 30616]|uniref:GPI anchored protein n=1 Tax=Coniochaeta ligniaria NRRL 30616 TaxID=1408157 RepID=A0A1J7JJ62_9PEZI|nr:hypothetical protein CONLIGDRAFT_715669 [Coniochaeta ligniaria NRRL 30616]